MTTPQQDIVFSFKLRKDGTPFTRNLVYEKLQNGDIILSPYTSWLVQLIPRIKAKGNELDPFKNVTIDLYLGGEGAYVANYKTGGVKNIEKFYKEDTTLKKLHQIKFEEDGA